MTDAQEQALVAHLATGAVFTAQDAVDWVAQRFQVTYTRDGMYSLFERLGCRPKVPRPHNPQRTPAAQEGWQKGGAAPRSGTRV